MNDVQRRKLFRHAIWVIWGVIHLLVVMVARYMWPPMSDGLPRLTLPLVALSPLYVYLIHRTDIHWSIGGLFSVKRWLDQQRLYGSARERESDRLRPGLAFQAITITTGFAALLAFQSLRFYRDTNGDKQSWSPLSRTLIVMAAYLVSACMLNLIQLSLHQLLNQTIWDQEQKKRFRLLLTRLRAPAWHLLLAAIIMILLIPPYPFTWICLLVNFIYGMLLHRYYFAVNIPADYPNRVPAPAA